MGVYIWVAAVVIFVLVESFTLELVSIWFAIASLVTVFVAFSGASYLVQLAVFAAISAVLLFFAMPFMRKFLKKNHQSTNADRIIGETALVTEEIDSLTDKGQVKVFGQIWSAKSLNGDKISSKSTVKILSIEGVHVVVEEHNFSKN